MLYYLTDILENEHVFILKHKTMRNSGIKGLIHTKIQINISENIQHVNYIVLKKFDLFYILIFSINIIFPAANKGGADGRG